MNITGMIREGEKLATCSDIVFGQNPDPKYTKTVAKKIYSNTSNIRYRRVKQKVDDANIFELLEMSHKRLTSILDDTSCYNQKMPDPRELNSSDIKTF
jgi:hypothetical protein